MQDLNLYLDKKGKRNDVNLSWNSQDVKINPSEKFFIYKICEKERTCKFRNIFHFHKKQDLINALFQN